MTATVGDESQPAQARSGMDAVLSAGGQVGALMAVTDWAATPLGAIADWPQSLKSAASICLLSRFPMVIFWGPELALVYNDAYLPILGAKHPRSLGQPGQECWAELWPVIGPMLAGVMDRGEATWSDDLLLLVERHGYPEEGYFTFSYSPIRDETGGVGGVFCALTETTERVVEERRLDTLRRLGLRTVRATSAEAACELAAATIAANPTDVPFALLYLTDADGRHARLAGTCGLPDGHPAAVATIDLTQPATEQPPGDGPAGLAASGLWPLATATAGEPVRLDGLTDRLIGAGRADWPPPDQALVLPISQPGASNPAGFMVAGVNPRRTLDSDYLSFFNMAARHIAAAVADARAYEQERRRAEALAEVDRAKTAFFSNVSHEFRTPLTLMLGPLDDLLAGAAGDLGPAVKAQLDVVHRNSLRLLKLVNTMLDFSRIEAGRTQANYVPVDLAAYTAELASNFRAAIERAGMRLLVDCPPLPAPVYVDRDMWEKIVLNLVSNAFKFTFHGEIEVRLRADDTHAQLTVRDTGIGIPAEELPRLFERFHRGQLSRGRTFEGTGIGLALVQELVKLHGGTVDASSTLNAGSTFTVRVPLGTAHLDPKRIGQAATQASTTTGARAYVEEALRWMPTSTDIPLPTSSDPAPAAGPGPSPDTGPDTGAGATPATGADQHTGRVLIADDNADMRDYLAGILTAHWTVETVPDGRAALAAVHSNPPDLVLTDVMMPKLDGFGLLAALRADKATRNIPVIILSARAGIEAAVEGLDAGADDYLTKPFTARELVARVRVHLTTARLRNQLIGQLTQEATELGELATRSARQVNQLEWALAHRIRIEQAKGLLMGRHGLQERAAWEWLRQAARSSRRRVDDVAGDLLAGRLIPRPPRQRPESASDTTP